MKKLIIMRGVPGSGKSSYVKEEFPDAAICSADRFMIDDDGNYKFDRNMIQTCHKLCRQEAEDAMADDVPLVVIDNTNIRVWEFRPYLDLAEKFGYEVEIIRIQEPTEEVCAARNLHGVPIETIRRMRENFEEFEG